MASGINLNILSAYNDKGVKEAIGSLSKLREGIGDVSKKLLGGFGAWEAYNKGVDFIRNSVDASRDLQRNLSGLQTIFGKSSGQMQAFAESGTAMGMSTAEAAKHVTFLGSVLKQSGFDMQSNMMFTKKLVSLGADLAATYGYDVQEALTGMTAMFRGEYDPIEKFGVAIKQAQVNAEMQRLGLNKLTGQEKLHAQQLIRMKFLLQATSDAQGAFTRNGDTLFVSQQRLSASFTNMQAKLGNSLIAPMTVLIQVMTALTETVGPHLESLFAVIGTYFTMAGDGAAGFAGQVSGLIDQLTNFLTLIQPIVALVMWLASNFGSAILAGVVAFKLLNGVIKTAQGIQMAYTAITAALTASNVAAAASAEALAVAETAAGEAAVASTAAMAATPWGAIAVAIAVVVGGLVAFSTMASKSADAGTDLAVSTSVMGTNMADASGKMLAYNQQVSDLGNNMSIVASKAQEAANANLALQGTMPDYFKARNAMRKDDTKAAKNKPKTPEELAIEKQLKDMKRLMNAGSLTGAAGKAAKAMVSPFQQAVQKIKGEMAALHDSLMGAFDITQMGSNGSTISRNMSKLMEKMRAFSALIKDLRAKGLNADLLTQIVKAGPVNGMDAAKALAGNADLINQANTSYAEYGQLATGIASETIQARYQNQYNINVDGGVGSGATIGKAVVAAIQAFERQSGSSWRA